MPRYEQRMGLYSSGHFFSSSESVAADAMDVSVQGKDNEEEKIKDTRIDHKGPPSEMQQHEGFSKLEVPKCRHHGLPCKMGFR